MQMENRALKRMRNPQYASHIIYSVIIQHYSNSTLVMQHFVCSFVPLNHLFYVFFML